MRRFATIILTVFLLPLAALCVIDGSTTAPAPTTARASTTATPTTARTSHNFAPIAYYEEYCSRCHGAFGTGYLPDMGKRLSDAALRQIIADMADGPAGAPLDDVQLDAQTAYHRSLLDGAPFIARTNENTLGGEVSAGATVSIEAGGRTSRAVVEGHTWKATEPSGDDVRIVAERDGKRTVLEPGKPFSHATSGR